MHHITSKNNSEMPEMKFILWVAYDITWFGLGGLSLLNTLFQNVDEIEKVIIFLMFMGMGIFRMIKMYHTNEEKRLNNEQLKLDIEKRKREMNKRSKQ